MPKINGKYKKVCLLLFFLIVVFIVYFVLSLKPQIVEEKIVSCEKHYADFTKLNKTLMLEFLEEGQDDTSQAYTDIYTSWLELKPLLLSSQCNLFEKSKSFERNIYKVSEFFRQAEEASLEKKPDQATLFYFQANKSISSLKKDNDIFDADNTFLDMYSTIQKIKTSTSKEEAAASLEQLKLKFTDLKQYSVDQEYLNGLESMEKEIAKLDKLLIGPEYTQAKENLYQLFMEIYYKY